MYIASTAPTFYAYVKNETGTEYQNRNWIKR